MLLVDDDDDEDDDDDDKTKEFFFESCVFLKNSCPDMERKVDERLKPCVRAAHLACEQRDVNHVLSTTREIREECWRQIESPDSSSSPELLRSIISEVSVTYAAAAAALGKDLRQGLRAVDEGLIFAPGEAGSLRRRMLRRVADILTVMIEKNDDDDKVPQRDLMIPSRIDDKDKTRSDIPVLSSDVTVDDFQAAITSTYRPVLVRRV